MHAVLREEHLGFDLALSNEPLKERLAKATLECAFTRHCRWKLVMVAEERNMLRAFHERHKRSRLNRLRRLVQQHKREVLVSQQRLTRANTRAADHL